MLPRPDCPVGTESSPGVAITGIAARFPDADNLDEFKDKLYGGVDMVTRDNRRWTPGLYGTPERSGKINILDRFDAQFFNISPKQAQVMDPMVRMLLETTYEAIFDSGINPAELRGSRTGVYVGLSSSASESNEYYLRVPENIDGLCGPGCCRSVFANRISLFFDFKGPSFPVDATCASSLLCLDLAVQAIMTGRCDSAIVAGANVCLKPEDTIMLYKLGVLSIDGRCKAFDARANGYVRSEAIVSIFLQKTTQQIYRNYGTVLGCISQNDGYRERGLLSPSESDQVNILNELYKEAGVDPTCITYVEAHGSGTEIGDEFELNAITKTLCKDRKSQLLVGSIKTNCGHSEPAAGFLSVFKVILAAQEHLLPANLHFEQPNPNIPGLFDERVKVVTKNTTWDGGIVGISAYGIGGNNSHAIISLNTKNKKENGFQDNNMKELILFSGRTKAGVLDSLHKLSSVQKDIEVFALLRNFFKLPVPQHVFRGYALVGGENEALLDTEVFEFHSRSPPPLWFIFSGMGSQWKGMGRELMKLCLFRESIIKSAKILESVHFNLAELIDGKVDFEGPIETFVGIVAIQVGMIDVLRGVGVVPDKFIGHSVGELSCGYADGCLSLEQAVLGAHARGAAIVDAKLPLGAMASVGLTWDEVKQKCPTDIYPACHNSPDNVTVSGPVDSIAAFVADLQTQGIFAKIVDSAGIAFHSEYIRQAEKKLHEEMKKLIPEPAIRSARWISSSFDLDILETSEIAQYSSADYYTHNLLSPVLFYEALQSIPNNSVVVEVGPHALLQPILKRSLNKTITHIPLLNRNAGSQNDFLLRALGKLYGAGLNLDVGKLYPPISFPVSLETPMLFPLVAWDHSQHWNVPNFEPSRKCHLSNFSLEELLEEALGRVQGRSSKKQSTVRYTCPSTPSKNDIKQEEIIVATKITSDKLPEKSALLKVLSETLSIPDFTNIGKQITVAEMGMDSMLAIQLKAELKSLYGVDMGMENILRLTLSSVEELEKNV